MSLPSRLFRYENISLQTIRNLKNQVVYLGAPRNFNDPYDCAISAALGDLSDDGLSQFLNGAQVAAPAEEVKALIKQGATKAISDIAESFINGRGISCFTEKNDNLLMWSHYADGGRGICLEFSTSESLFEKAKKVNYVDDIPRLSLDRLLCENNYEDVMELFRTKSTAWQYEQEWRVMHEKAGTAWTYDSKSLTGIYFGPSAPEDLVNIVCLVVLGQNEHVRFYTGHRSNEQFKVGFTQFEYISHLDAVKRGLKA